MPEHLKVAIESSLNHSKNYLRRPDLLPESPYTTLFHRDLWTKNVMIKRGNQPTNATLFEPPIFTKAGYIILSFEVLDLIFVPSKQIPSLIVKMVKRVS